MSLFNEEQARRILNFLVDKSLSQKEIEVASLVAQGLSNGEIAKELFVTEKTVKFHLTNVFKKLGTKSRSKLMVLAFQQALDLPSEEPVEETVEEMMDDQEDVPTLATSNHNATKGVWG